jgi:hypothetical protein
MIFSTPAPAQVENRISVADRLSASTAAPAAPAQYLSENDLLLYSVQLDNVTLSETLTAYGSPTDPLLPVGELSRLLDLDVTVLAADRRVVGTLGQERRSLTIDLASGITKVGGRNIVLGKDDVGLTRSDMYIRASVLQQILPVQFDVNAEGLLITITGREKLPIEAKIERLAAGRDLNSNVQGATEKPLRIESPYKLFTPPSFDVAVQAGRDTRAAPPYSARYDLRFAGDLLYTNVQGYVGSDQSGRIDSMRITFDRRSAHGDLPLGATRISAGDVFTPALSIGPRSIDGRGISFSTVPLEQTSVFKTIDIRGELPIGYDAELYVNDVLRNRQATPVQGQYEFLNVPLVGGINVIRVVVYGVRGDRSESVRIINVGGGQLRRNQTEMEFGAVDAGHALIEPNPQSVVTETSGPRIIGSIAHGLSDDVTVVGGIALYTAVGGARRKMATAGIRTSLAGFAIQADGAADTTGGAALAIGLAGQPFGISTVFNHSEYRGSFLDETAAAFDSSRPLRSHTALTLDFSLPRIFGISVPLSMNGLHNIFADGGSDWTAALRASTTVAGTFLSSAFDYQLNTRPNAPKQQQLNGNFSASRFLNFKWQLRASADYELLPSAQLRALSLTADRSLSDRLTMHLGLGKSFVSGSDTFGQAGAVLRLPIGDLSLDGNYGMLHHDWGISARFAFGSLFDPTRGRYLVTPPGPASGGNAVFQAFLDHDGDGRLGPGDTPLPGVVVEGGSRKATTDSSGRAVVTGLGTSPTGWVEADTKDVEQIYVNAPPSRVEFSPRAGQVLEIPYPMAPVGEVFAHLVTPVPGGQMVGVSAVQVRLVAPGRDPMVAITEFDGTVDFSNVPLGTYRLELDPAQAARLGMRLSTSPSVKVQADKDAQVDIVVEFAPKASDAGPSAPAGE